MVTACTSLFYLILPFLRYVLAKYGLNLPDFILKKVNYADISSVKILFIRIPRLKQIKI